MDQEPWFGVEIRHLAALAAVARERSFRGAADRLGYVQSAVSQQVANLERLVGQRLVERTRGSKEVHLTDAGEVLVGHAEEILGRLNAARADLAASADPESDATLRVGLSQSVATGLLPEILRRLAATSPDLRVIPVEPAGEVTLFELIESGSVDVAFSDTPLESEAFNSSMVLSDSCSLLVPAGSGWADPAEPPTLEQLSSIPLIALDSWRFTATLEIWFAAQGLDARFALRAESEATVRAYVAAGLGAAIVPTLGVDRGDDAAIGVVDLGGVLPTRRVALYWHRSRQLGPGLPALRDAAQTVAFELSARRRADTAGLAAPAALAAA